MEMARPLSQQLGSSDEELLGALLASVADAVYAVDADGRVRYANPAALAILGYDEGELVGRPSHATIHHHRPDGEPFPEQDCPLLAPRATGEPVRVELDWFVRRDGSFVPVAYSSAPVSVNGQRGAVVVFRDVTDRARAEEERRRAESINASRTRLVQATLDERRRLARDLHDGAQQRLVNLAVALRAAATAAETDPTREALEAASEETRAVLADLRDLAVGLHPTILTNRGLAAAVTSLTARSTIPVGLDIPAERFPELIEATAYFVIAEALANVAKHAEASEASVRVRVRPDGWLELTIADDGIGGARLAADGTGLDGLRDRVAVVGGTLALESPPGVGTTVTLRLPPSLSATENAAG